MALKANATFRTIQNEHLPHRDRLPGLSLITCEEHPLTAIFCATHRKEPSYASLW